MDEDSVDGKPCRLAVNMQVEADEDGVRLLRERPAGHRLAEHSHRRRSAARVLLMIPYMYALYTMDTTMLLNSGT